MDHIVTLDSGSNEIEDLLNGEKTMIIHGADSKNIPYGMVNEGDVLYFVDNECRFEVKARGFVTSVENSLRLSEEESFEMIIRNQARLCLHDELFYKWAGKKYLVLIGLRDVSRVHPFQVNRSVFLSTNDWCLIGDIRDSLSFTNLTRMDCGSARNRTAPRA